MFRGTAVRCTMFTLAALLLSAQAALAQPASLDPESDGPVIASLDGRSVSLDIATQYHCHDFASPELRCFTSVEDHDLDFFGGDGNSVSVLSSSGYVIAWSGNSYSGSSVTLTQNYSNLGTIGWNDRISSYKVYTSLSGAFYEHTSYTGLVQTYCCNAQVAYVGDTRNNTFSSFKLP
jgi:hypothetical protein